MVKEIKSSLAGLRAQQEVNNSMRKVVVVEIIQMNHSSSKIIGMM